MRAPGGAGSLAGGRVSGGQEEVGSARLRAVLFAVFLRTMRPDRRSPSMPTGNPDGCAGSAAPAASAAPVRRPPGKSSGAGSLVRASSPPPASRRCPSGWANSTACSSAKPCGRPRAQFQTGVKAADVVVNWMSLLTLW